MEEKNLVPQRWKSLSIKEKWGLISGTLAFVMGWGLTIAGFAVHPVGEVHSSVLYVLGQSLIYAASIYGVASFLTYELGKIKQSIHNKGNGDKIE